MIHDTKAYTCRYGADKLVKLVDTLQSNLSYTKKESDIEFIHQSRVTTRRIRAIIPIFSFCFDENDYRLWRAEVKKLTRSLGKARDLDVQILFLERKLDEVTEEVRFGLEYLYHSHLDKRKTIQPEVLSIIETFIKSGILEEMYANLTKILEREKDREISRVEIQPTAEENICSCLSEMLALKNYVDIEEAFVEHHQIRIAAKKLRYRMEIFQDIYNDGITPMIDTIKSFQDLLGEIHDTDVWISYIPTFINGIDVSLSTNDKNEIIRGLNQFLSQLHERRRKLYTEFKTNWDKQKTEGFFKKIRVLITSEKDEIEEPGRKKILYAVNKILLKYDPYPSHSKQVTKIALKIFDNIIDVYRLGLSDRKLLEYSSLLHDIGWYSGSEGHSISSRELILANKDLPIKKYSRLIIANIAMYHNKGILGPENRYYKLLDPEDIDRINKLAAILRVADGLDASHEAVVEKIDVIVRKEEIKLICKVSKDIEMENDALRKKKKLFNKLFNKKIRVEWTKL